MAKTSNGIVLDGELLQDGSFVVEVGWCKRNGKDSKRVWSVVKGATVVEALGLAMAAVVAGGGLRHTPAPRISMVGISRHLETDKET